MRRLDCCDLIIMMVFNVHHKLDQRLTGITADTPRCAPVAVLQALIGDSTWTKLKSTALRLTDMTADTQGCALGCRSPGVYRRSLKLDIEELKKYLEQATRQKSKDILTIEIRRLETDLSKQLEDIQSPLIKSSPIPTPVNKCYEVKLNNYAWDQSEKFIKIYITLKNVQSLPKEAVYCNFTERSIDLHVMGLDNKNYLLPINNLCEEIVPEQSYTKVKTDMIAIFLAKQTPKNWSHVTGVEKKIKEAKTPAVPDMGSDNDPSSSLMSLMKRFYDEGDDDMKKTIAKAWTESQDKRSSGLPPVPSL